MWRSCRSLVGVLKNVYAIHMQFEWHALKAEANSHKHGVTFDEARSCFFDLKQIAFDDPDHSEAEDRELLIGHSDQGRLLS